MTPHPDGQAREWLNSGLVALCAPEEEVLESLQVLLARVRLEEAEWWRDFHCGEEHELKDCLCCQHIASLRQAAGEGTQP